MRSSVRFSPRMNRWFYSVFGILFFSGVAWLGVRYLGDLNNEFDAPYSFLGPALLKVHGAAAMASLVVLGVLIPSHMRRAWARRRNRTAAILILACCGLLILSGYGLYYCGDENLRFLISGFHSAAGCLLPFVLIWHVISGRKSRPHLTALRRL